MAFAMDTRVEHMQASRPDYLQRRKTKKEKIGNTWKEIERNVGID